MLLNICHGAFLGRFFLKAPSLGWFVPDFDGGSHSGRVVIFSPLTYNPSHLLMALYFYLTGLWFSVQFSSANYQITILRFNQEIPVWIPQNWMICSCNFCKKRDSSLWGIFLLYTSLTGYWLSSQIEVSDPSHEF